MKKLEARMFYGDYKEIKEILRMSKYDETTKEAVFYLSNCKKYTIEAKEEEFTFLTASTHDHKMPSAPPIEHLFLIESDSRRQELITHCFKDHLYKEDIEDWKFFRKVEDLTGEELLQELKNNSIY